MKQPMQDALATRAEMVLRRFVANHESEPGHHGGNVYMTHAQARALVGRLSSARGLESADTARIDALEWHVRRAATADGGVYLEVPADCDPETGIILLGSRTMDGHTAASGDDLRAAIDAVREAEHGKAQ